jgi:hypothetical protein
MSAYGPTADLGCAVQTAIQFAEWPAYPLTELRELGIVQSFLGWRRIASPWSAKVVGTARFEGRQLISENQMQSGARRTQA